NPASAPTFVAPRAHEHPGTVQPLALNDELQFALTEASTDVFKPLLGCPVAPIPKHHRAAAILPFRNCSLEVAVVERMVFHLHRQAPVVRIERRALWHRPGVEGPFELQTKVEVQVSGGVLLNNKAQGLGW